MTKHIDLIIKSREDIEIIATVSATRWEDLGARMDADLARLKAKQDVRFARKAAELGMADADEYRAHLRRRMAERRAAELAAA